VRVYCRRQRERGVWGTVTDRGRESGGCRREREGAREREELRQRRKHRRSSRLENFSDFLP